MEYSYYISSLIKEVNSSLGRDNKMNPNNREILVNTLESFIPIINDLIEGRDTSSDDRSNTVLNISKYIKEKLKRDIDDSLNEIDDYLHMDNIDRYHIEDLNSFRKDLDNLIEGYLK
nr:MAG TPA: hypothetical protein [Caudoviricetes sp.]